MELGVRGEWLGEGVPLVPRPPPHLTTYPLSTIPTKPTTLRPSRSSRIMPSDDKCYVLSFQKIKPNDCRSRVDDECCTIVGWMLSCGEVGVMVVGGG